MHITTGLIGILFAHVIHNLMVINTVRPETITIIEGNL